MLYVSVGGAVSSSMGCLKLEDPLGACHFLIWLQNGDDRETGASFGWVRRKIRTSFKFSGVKDA